MGDKLTDIDEKSIIEKQRLLRTEIKWDVCPLAYQKCSGAREEKKFELFCSKGRYMDCACYISNCILNQDSDI